MGAVKDIYIGIQELIWSALELGMRNPDAICKYVCAFEPWASKSMVLEVLEDIRIDAESEYLWA